MRGLELRRKITRGMTLVEVLVSLVITFIVFLGLSGSGLFVLNENIKNELRDEAVSVADSAVRMRVARRSTTWSPCRRPTCPPAGPQRKQALYRHADGHEPRRGQPQVTINVAWTRIEGSATRSYSHQVVTVVRRP